MKNIIFGGCGSVMQEGLSVEQFNVLSIKRIFFYFVGSKPHPFFIAAKLFFVYGLPRK